VVVIKLLAGHPLRMLTGTRVDLKKMTALPKTMSWADLFSPNPSSSRHSYVPASEGRTNRITKLLAPVDELISTENLIVYGSRKFIPV